MNDLKRRRIEREIKLYKGYIHDMDTERTTKFYKHKIRMLRKILNY